MEPATAMPPEARARQKIDELLTADGAGPRPNQSRCQPRRCHSRVLGHDRRHRLHALCGPQGLRRAGSQAGRRHPHRLRGTIGQISRRTEAWHPVLGDQPYIRIRKHRRRDTFHGPPRSPAALAPPVRLPPSRIPAGHAQARQQPAPAAPIIADGRSRRTARLPDRGDHLPRCIAETR